jgi:hypothetical protein
MKKFERGSEWRRWDLHVHSPYSYLANEFTGQDIISKWSTYMSDLQKITEISVLGITDYFSVDGYKKVREEFEKGKLSNIDEILPNCEIRINPRTRPGIRLNMHFIFNPKIVDNLEDWFFSKLGYIHSDTENYLCTKNGMKTLGRTIRNDDSLCEDAAIKEAAAVMAFNLDDIEKIMQNKKLRDNTLIIVPNSSTDGASGLYIKDNGDRINVDEVIRTRIYKLSDLIFSSLESDVEYFKSQDCLDKYQKKMTCVHGSDAHTNKKIGELDNQKYNLIKAHPTFEGLKQLKYEKDRS